MKVTLEYVPGELDVLVEEVHAWQTKNGINAENVLEAVLDAFQQKKIIMDGFSLIPIRETIATDSKQSGDNDRDALHIPFYSNAFRNIYGEWEKHCSMEAKMRFARTTRPYF